MTTPSPDSIREFVEKSERFLDWLIEVLRGKSLVKKLLLIEVILFSVFNPFFPAVFERITGKKTPVWYDWLFWSAFILVFIVATIAALRIKKEQGLDGKWDDYSAIKGLLSFGFEDAEVFRRLQREEEVHEWLPALTDPQFRFGILCGESGCGKTSFLQAGLWPKLSKQGHRCLSVKFTDLDPLDSIRMALVEQSRLSVRALDNANLLNLLESSLQLDSRPLILLFDQFEQFFVHRKRAKQRKPFVQDLAAWYRKQPSLRVKVLICIREDFAGRLVELQRAMGYSLGPQQSFRLEKFEPEKATKIFQVMAETAKVGFDESFVSEFTQQELASQEDGLISPVDIQILAWMVAGQKCQEDRAFNRASFRKLGGIEGLLERFLTRAIKSRETKDRQDAAKTVLLALTDLDGNARAGVLTLDALKKKVSSTISDREVKETLEWLARADLRLVNSINDGYELAHERLIPALRRIAVKELSSTDKASQLLDRRVNEWRDNNQASRYLLTWREWRLIEKQLANLNLEPKKHHKELLLTRTRRRWRIRQLSVISALLIASSLGIGNIVWRNSESGQIHLINTDLLGLSEGINDQDVLKVIVESFTVSDMHQLAYQVADGIKHRDRKNAILLVIGEAMAKAAVAKQSTSLLSNSVEISKRTNGPAFDPISMKGIAAAIAKIDSNQSSELLDQVVEIVLAAESEEYKAIALSGVAAAIAKMDDRRSADLFDQAIKIATAIDNSLMRNHALSEIARNLPKAALAKQSTEPLRQAIEVTKRIDDLPKAVILQAIAEAIAKIEAKGSSELFDQIVEIAQGISEPRYKAKALTNVAAATVRIDEGRSVQLLNQALNIINREVTPFTQEETVKALVQVAVAKGSASSLELPVKIANGMNASYTKIIVSSLIARTMADIAVANQSPELLEKSIRFAKEIQFGDTEANVLEELVKAVTKLNGDRSSESLDQIVEIAQRMSEPKNKAFNLGRIASAIAKVDAKRSLQLLDDALRIADTIDSRYSRSDSLRSIARAMAEVAGANHQIELLERAIRIVEGLEDSESTFPLSAIVAAAVKLKDLRLARYAAMLNRDNKDKAMALASVLKNLAELTNPALKDIDGEEIYRWGRDVWMSERISVNRI